MLLEFYRVWAHFQNSKSMTFGRVAFTSRPTPGTRITVRSTDNEEYIGVVRTIHMHGTQLNGNSKVEWDLQGTDKVENLPLLVFEIDGLDEWGLPTAREGKQSE